MSRLISYSQNGEDVRIWRAFRALTPPAASGHFTYVDVGANHPYDLSITASLYDQGWRGLLVEADPYFAEQLRRFRPHDQVVEVAASDRTGEITFHRVLGTGLGTLSGSEAHAAEDAGFAVEEFLAPTKPLNQILEEYFAHRSGSDIHFMSIDVEGAEPLVLAGLDLNRFRPWVICVEAIDAETKEPNHQTWQSHLLAGNYRDVAFDGINRWYVAEEHAELVENIATPLNPIDAGRYGWVSSDTASAANLANKSYNRVAWQRASLLNHATEIEAAQERDQQLAALTQQLNAVNASRAHRIAQPIDRVLRKVKSTVIAASGKLPAPLRRWTIRKRHLRIVTPAMQVYTDSAFLGGASAFTPSWANPELKPPVPTAGMELGSLSQEEITETEAWLAGGPFDTDAQLEVRTDGMNDELGRTLAALRNRVWLSVLGQPSGPVTSEAGKILFDARSLQTPTFGARGIGRFAHAALASVRSSAADQDVVLLVDPGLNQLPTELVGQCEQINTVSAARALEYALVVQPSPMTADPRPLIEVLRRDIAKVAIVFDFIPMHFPSVYLRHVAPRTEYAAALDSLTTYNDYLCISELTKGELVQFLAGR
ncbi:MAG: FkbM family methyltransferase, partial [Candidatus Nanopelagicales bacterium]|nr:FkbM family methyltransferase [Candidatus Nanopelagicales bacterium]